MCLDLPPILNTRVWTLLGRLGLAYASVQSRSVPTGRGFPPGNLAARALASPAAKQMTDPPSLIPVPWLLIPARCLLPAACCPLPAARPPGDAVRA